MTNAYSLVISFLLLLLAAFNTSAGEAESGPQVMLERVGEQLFTEIGKVNRDGLADKAELVGIVESNLMPYIDIKFVSYKLLGKHIKTVKRPQALAFFDAVEHYLSNTYAGALSKYKGQTVEFEPGLRLKNEKFASVKAHIIDENAPTIDLDFKLRRTKEGQWKVYDMVAEGISLLSAKQKEIIARISEVGIDKVIEELHAG